MPVPAASSATPGEKGVASCGNGAEYPHFPTPILRPREIGDASCGNRAEYPHFPTPFLRPREIGDA